MMCTCDELEPGPPFQRNVSGRGAEPGGRSTVYAMKNMLPCTSPASLLAMCMSPARAGARRGGREDRKRKAGTDKKESWTLRKRTRQYGLALRERMNSQISQT